MNSNRHQQHLRASADQPPVHAYHSEAPVIVTDTGRDASSYNPVKHVGDLETSRSVPYISYEGRGLSVSQCPQAWKQIMQSSGKTYELNNPNSWFYVIEPSTTLTTSERNWAINAGYVKQTEGYRLTLSPRSSDPHRSEKSYLYYDSETAEQEADGHPDMVASITREQLYALGPTGGEYWKQSFKQPPNKACPVVIRDLIPVWYAQHLGFDGVWWLNTYDPENYSAPRGAIFQEKLSEWKCTSHDITLTPDDTPYRN